MTPPSLEPTNAQPLTRRTAYRRTARGAVRWAAIEAACCGAVWRPPSTPRVQILLLHHLFADEQEPFRRLLAWASDHYEFVTYSRAIDLIRSGSARRATLAFSFDDGLGTCLQAAEVLEEYGARGCFFVCPGVVGRRPEHDFYRMRFGLPPMPLMDWSDLEWLKERGHEIGVHTMTHRKLSQLGAVDLDFEIANSQREIARRFGEARHFAWPFGRWEDFSRDAALRVFQAGYGSCASGIRGAHAMKGSSTGPGRWIARRESIQAGWPLRHVAYFLTRSSRHPVPRDGLWPPEWNAMQDSQRQGVHVVTAA